MKYIFNNKEYEKNNRSGRGYGNLIYDIFKYYLEQNQDKTYVQLQNVFNRLHKEFSGEKSKKKVVFNKRDFLSWLNDANNKDSDRNKRYFGYGNYGKPLMYNGEELYFTTQWGNKDGDYGNINRFVDFAIDELDYEVEKIDDIVQTNNDFNKKGNFLKIKNIMLYGAPGVGKTHNYKKLISMIEKGESEKEIFYEVSVNNDTKDFDETTFNTVKNEKRIEFVSFHQSYSYEDFIEGFRPNENGEIELDKYGIFKKICKDAETNYSKSNDIKEVLFKDAINILLKEKIENEEHVQIKLKRKNSFYKIYDFNEKTIFFEKQNGDKSHSLALKTLEKMYDEEENNVVVGGLAPYYNPLLEELLKIKKTSKVEKVERKNYYIVIDEINRGNISKIFGELITLIEEDKRDTYEVTLPYSKDKFKIPSNLYIIATMNSTDKSIATIDIALRRRFTFLKMKPNENLVDDIEAKKLMNSLNTFIGNTLGEDYQLGHSYFMKVKNDEDLEFIIEYKIKPLLEEYFYADEENYKEVLSLINKKEEKEK